MQPLFALFATTDDRELAKVVEYLKEENRILREKLLRTVENLRVEFRDVPGSN